MADHLTRTEYEQRTITTPDGYESPLCFHLSILLPWTHKFCAPWAPAAVRQAYDDLIGADAVDVFVARQAEWNWDDDSDPLDWLNACIDEAEAARAR